MSQNKKAKANNKQRNVHIFRDVRDPLVTDAYAASPVVSSIASDASGNGSAQYTLAPMGVTGAKPTANTSTGAVTWAMSPFEKPYLPWLLNQGRGFKEYRVSTARLVFTGNVGSTATGRIAVVSSPDVMDANTPLTLGNITGGISFDLASLANKEKSIPLTIDSSWKKVTDRSMLVDATGAIAASSSVHDLSFCSLRVQLIAATQSGTLGVFVAANMFVVYDVEFRGPISITLNS